LYQRCKLLRDHGQSSKHYHECFGFNYRMTEMSGALGLEQLKQLQGFNEKRRQNAKYLNERLEEIEGISVPFVAQGVEHTFHHYSILLDLAQFKCSRDEFVAALKREGVEAAIHYPLAINQQPAFLSNATTLPNCEWLAERIMSLPVHPRLSKQDLEQVCQSVKTVAAEMHH
jgi:perosamine synthetase